MGLDLTPNKSLGYRLRADRYNWIVAEIRVHGEGSKNAGKEYAADVVGYYKSLDIALSALLEKDARAKMEVMDVKAALASAKEEIRLMAADLQARIDATGLPAHRLLGGVDDDDEGAPTE